MGHEKDILNGKICAAQSYLLSCYSGSFLSYTFVHLFTPLCISANLYKFFLHLYVSKIHSFTLISIYENSTLLRKFSKRDEAISSVLGRHQSGGGFVIITFGGDLFINETTVGRSLSLKVELLIELPLDSVRVCAQGPANPFDIDQTSDYCLSSFDDFYSAQSNTILSLGSLTHKLHGSIFFFFSLLKPGHNKVFYLCFCLTKKPNLTYP